MKPRLLLAISLLALVGIVLSAVSLKNHYSGTPSDYCDLGETFNCDLVNRSVYSRFLGIPVALIGLLGYGLLLGLSRVSGRSRAASRALLASSLLGLAFSLYLTYLEAYVLGVWCVVCLGSLAIVVGIVALAVVALAKPRVET